MLNSENKRYYYDSTGCGASFNAENPYVLQLITDSLRYWTEEMHVDGFRFDLATTLCRRKGGFTAESGFLYAVRQDPVLKKRQIDCRTMGRGRRRLSAGRVSAGLE